MSSLDSSALSLNVLKRKCMNLACVNSTQGWLERSSIQNYSRTFFHHPFGFCHGHCSCNGTGLLEGSKLDRGTWKTDHQVSRSHLHCCTLLDLNISGFELLPVFLTYFFWKKTPILTWVLILILFFFFFVPEKITNFQLVSCLAPPVKVLSKDVTKHSMCHFTCT